MADAKDKKDQQHPQYQGDRSLVSDLLRADQPSDLNLADLARLCIRYRGFPGARDIQTDCSRFYKSGNYPNPNCLLKRGKFTVQIKSMVPLKMVEMTGLDTPADKSEDF